MGDELLRIAINQTLRRVLLGVVVGPDEIRAATEELLPIADAGPSRERWALRRETALVRMAELKSAGKDRSAAMIVARELAADPREIKMLAQQCRAWWRQRKTKSSSPPRRKPRRYSRRHGEETSRSR